MIQDAQTIDDQTKNEIDGNDAQGTKNLHNYALDDIDQNNILFKHKPVDDTPNYSSPPDPSPTFSDIMLPKNKNRGKLVKKTNQKLRRNREMVKKAGKRPLQELNKAKYKQTDDAKTVKYDDDLNIDDFAMVRYYSNTEMGLTVKIAPPTVLHNSKQKG